MVLIVEDQPILALNLQIALEEVGAETVIARGPQETLVRLNQTMCSAEKPAVVTDGAESEVGRGPACAEQVQHDQTHSHCRGSGGQSCHYARCAERSGLSPDRSVERRRWHQTGTKRTTRSDSNGHSAPSH